MTAGHGPNIGHGYVKYVVIDQAGNELLPVVFPAMISRAGRSVAGAIARVDTVSAGGAQWWTGEDALLAPSPLIILAQERLSDPEPAGDGPQARAHAVTGIVRWIWILSTG